jgi:hypothetical protein
MGIEFVTGLVRHLMSAGGAWLSAQGIATASETEAITGGVVALLAVVWSWLAKSKSNPIV